MKKVLWLQVCGLAAVQGAIALMWVIYNLYLLKLLTQFGFPASLATGLLILENILAVVMEPLMGSLSDQQQRWLGTRFPLISGGVVLASACFIAIPVYTVFSVSSGATGALHWLFPALFVAWALAMTVFRSPVLSLLGQYAFDTHLPQAASILTLVGGLAGAMGPLASEFILAQGPILTFTAGSITLLLAATALRLVEPGAAYATYGSGAGEVNAKADVPGELLPLTRWVPQLALVFGCGAGIGLGFRLMMLVFPQVIKTQVPEANASLILGSIFLAIAITAIPFGVLASRWGNSRSMAMGLGIMALLMGILWSVHSGWMAGGMAIALGAVFSLVSNGTIPFALMHAPPSRAALGTGMYFSGAALANCVFGALFGQLNNLSLTSGALIGAAAFLAAGGCVMLSGHLNRV